MDHVVAPSARPADEPPAAPTRALVSWALYDWAAQPFYTLIQTFLFATYFATVVVGDAEKGQAAWGYAAAFAGAVVALGSPVLGAIADGGGRRKPWIAVCALVMIAGMCLLWLARPGATGMAYWLVLAGYAMAFAGAEFAAVFTNAIMPTLVPSSRLGRLSGIGWGLGYTGGLVSLVLVASLVVTDPATGKTLLGFDPLVALDTATRESDRIIGPLSALWFAVFALPFFLFTPDRRPAVAAITDRSVGAALRRLWQTIRELPRHRDILFLLLARVLYSDGLAAIFVFGGIYGAAVFGWRSIDLGIFGIILSLTGALGAVLGGFLDDRLGARTVIMGSLALLLVAVLGVLSVDKTHVLYTIEIAQKAPGSKPFSSLGELVFLGFAMVIGLVAAPVQAAGRSLLARLAPPDRMTQFFGLFAFSGKATAFLAPLAVAIITEQTGSQRLGVAVTAAFVLIGLLLMIPVREPARAR